MFVWQAHEGAVTSLAFGPGGRFLVSAGADEQVKVWEPFTGAEQLAFSIRPKGGTRLPGRAHSVPHGLAIAHDGNTAAVAYLDYELVFFDPLHGDILARREDGQVLAVKPAPDGMSVFVLLASPNVIQQYHLADGRPMASVGQPDWRPVLSLGVSPCATRVAAGRGIYKWPPDRTGQSVTSARLKDNIPVDLAFSADMQHLFALVGGKVMVYSVETTLLKTKLKGHQGKITAMALAPDGRRLWTASRDATVKCWDTHSLTLDRTFRFDTGGLDCLAVSPDGNVAAVGSGQKGTITVWDLG